MTLVRTAVPLAAYRRFRTMLAWRDIDALLASYPKAGRTWLRFILANYLKMVVTPDQPADLHNMFTVLPNLAWDPERGIPAFAFRQSGAVPLIAVTHADPNRFLRPDCPIILMVRDPRDVMVSAYFHATRHKHRFSGNIDGFVRHPTLGLAALIRHLNTWSTVLPRHPHHILQYERLSAAPEAATDEVLGFLGIERDKALIARAVEAAKFGNMRKLEVERGIPGHDYDRSDTQALRTRRGRVGGFEKELSSRTAAWIFSTYKDSVVSSLFDLCHPPLAIPRPANPHRPFLGAQPALL